MSTAAKVTHTPGPWQSLFDADGDHAIFGPDNVLLAVTSGEPYVSYAVDEANAHLIAAAPELLGALELVSLQNGSYLSSDAKAFIDIAIRKAKGESQ